MPLWHEKTSSTTTTSTTDYPRNISQNIPCNASHVCEPTKSISFVSTSTFILAWKLECVQNCQDEEVGFLTLCFVTWRGEASGSIQQSLKGQKKGCHQSDQHWYCFKGNIGGISERHGGIHNMWAFLRASVDIYNTVLNRSGLN